MSNLPIVAGVTTATKVLLEKPRRELGRDGNWSVTYRYAVENGQAFAETPAWGAAIPSPEVSDHPNLILTGATIEPLPDGHNSILSLVYEEPTGTNLFPGGGAIRSTRSAVVERMVDEISGISDSDSNDLKALDRRSVPYFTLSYSRRNVESSFTWSEANVLSGVGKRSAPTGLTTPTTDAWLKTERNVTELASGGDVEIDEVWTYDENLWDSRIYGT